MRTKRTAKDHWQCTQEGNKDTVSVRRIDAATNLVSLFPYNGYPQAKIVKRAETRALIMKWLSGGGS